MKKLSWFVCCLLICACGSGPLEPRVLQHWQVNPTNVAAFVENRHNHNAALSTPDSHYVAYSGVASGARNTDIFLRRLDRSSGEWGPTRKVSVARALHRAPQLVLLGETLVVAWVADRTEADGPVAIAVRRSSDRGASWDETQFLEVGQIRTRTAQLLSDGQRLYLCLSNAEPGLRQQIILFVSADSGDSWAEKRFGDLAARQNSIQPILASGGPGHLLLTWFETTRKGRLINAVYSRDGGDSWSEPLPINDSSLLMAREHCLVVRGDRALLAWTVLDGSQGRLIIDQSSDGGMTWGEDRILFEDHVRVITPVCNNLEQNRMLVSWSLASTAVGELGMRILYDVVDAAAKAGGSSVQSEKSLIGPPVVGRTYQKYDVAAVDSLIASTYSTGAPRNLGVFVSAGSPLGDGLPPGTLVTEEGSKTDFLSPRIGGIEDGHLTLVYNSRPAPENPTSNASRLGNLFLAVVELQ